MRLNTLYLIGTLAVAAVPLSAAAQPVQANRQTAAGTEQTMTAPDACATGWVWEPAGYMGNGHWRPAHCAARNTIPF
jgi:hypothetical protein